jgi:hypothetical protein
MSPLVIRSAVMRMWDSELGGGVAPSPLGGGRCCMNKVRLAIDER